MERTIQDKLARSGISRRSFNLAAFAGLGVLAVGAPRAAAQAGAEIKVGLLAGLSGGGAQIGQWMVDGVTCAIDILNKVEGGPRYSLIAEDCQWNGQKGVEGYNKLVNIDKIDVLVSAGSPVEEAIAPLCDQNQMVNLNVGAQSPKMADIGKFTLSVLQLADYDIKVLSKYARDTLKYTNVAVLYVNNDTGKFNQSEFKKTFEELGGKVVAAEAFKPQETNFGAQLAKIRVASPEAVYVVGAPGEMPFAVKQLRAVMPDTPILSYVGIESQEFLDAAGASAEGIVYTTTAFDPTSGETLMKSFVATYEALRNAPPKSPYLGYGFDAMVIVDAALKKSGGKTGEPLRAAIYDIREFAGITGKSVFQDNGTVAKAIAIKTIKNGAFDVVTVVAP